jgi:hypothetical protein
VPYVHHLTHGSEIWKDRAAAGDVLHRRQLHRRFAQQLVDDRAALLEPLGDIRGQLRPLDLTPKGHLHAVQRESTGRTPVLQDELGVLHRLLVDGQRLTDAVAQHLARTFDLALRVRQLHPGQRAPYLSGGGR